MVNTKTCPVCNTEFTFEAARGYNYKYCSDECHREIRTQRRAVAQDNRVYKPLTREQQTARYERQKVLNNRTPERAEEIRQQRLKSGRKHRAKYRERDNKKMRDKRAANYEESRKKEKAEAAKNKLRVINNPSYALHVQQRRNKYNMKRLSENLEANIIHKVRNRIRTAVKRAGTVKSRRTITLLGCTIDEFKQYFQGRFTKGMTWARFIAAEIHIDHIKPCTSFNLTKESEQKKCFHYTNCQPLWAKDNIRKGAKIA